MKEDIISLLRIAKQAARLLRDIRNEGLQVGGEQYPNTYNCVDVAEKLEKVLDRIYLKGKIKIKQVDDVYVLTNVVSIPESVENIYWFGRVDRKDEMKALKIVAKNSSRAWDILESHYKAAVGDNQND